MSYLRNYGFYILFQLKPLFGVFGCRGRVPLPQRDTEMLQSWRARAVRGDDDILRPSRERG